ncbi:MAG: transcriptional regulator HexR [Clostridiales bacterium]|nr:transcriptional regulator HexR [Clostridiales bacterium]
MNVKSNIIQKITKEIDSYSASYQRIGKLILEQPEKIVKMSIGRLSQLASVSDPTIMRFCAMLGFSGFKDFKLQLAKELAIKENYLHLGIEDNDNPNSYIRKVGITTISSLSEVINSLNEDLINSLVDTLSEADKIEFWGQGASAVVAQDAYHKFFRAGISCVASSDPHMQCMSAGVMTKGDVVVAISHTGKSYDLIRNVKIAKEQGGIIIGITMDKSPLAKECTMAVGVNVDEDTDIYLPMISRLAHLLVLDILAVGVMLKKGKEATDRMKKMKEALMRIKYSASEEMADE